MSFLTWADIEEPAHLRPVASSGALRTQSAALGRSSFIEGNLAVPLAWEQVVQKSIAKELEESQVAPDDNVFYLRHIDRERFQAKKKDTEDRESLHQAVLGMIAAPQWEHFSTFTFEDRFVAGVPGWAQEWAVKNQRMANAHLPIEWRGASKLRKIMTQSLPYVWRQARKYHNALSAIVYGRRWKQHGMQVPGFYVVEPQKRGALHIHALIGSTVSARHPDGYSRGRMDELWSMIHGHGFAKILPVSGEAREYVAKQVHYTVKGVPAGMSWEILGWEGHLAPELRIGQQRALQGF